MLLKGLQRWLNRHPETTNSGRRTSKRPAKSSFRPRLEALETRALPSALFVTSTADSGAGSLRNEIASAVDGDSIGFNLPSPSTIQLTSGTLTISHNITIAGPGPSALTVAGNGTFEIFSFADSNDSLSGLTVTGGGNSSSGGGIYAQGKFVLSNCVVTQNHANLGGGIYQPAGDMTITDCVISFNVAEQGGGLETSGNSVIIRRTTITNNQALSTDPNISGIGGGIANDSPMTLLDSVVSNNLALGTSIGAGTTGEGGGIYNSTQSLTVMNSTISGNMAEGEAIDNNPGKDGKGGGIYDYAGAVTVIGSTIAHNFAGGASSRNSSNGGEGLGAGADIDTGSATFTNSTICANTAQGGNDDSGSGGSAYGGGVVSFGGTLRFTNCTIVQNSAIGGIGNNGQGVGLMGGIGWNTQVSNSLLNCIVAVNTALSNADMSFYSGTAGFNLIGDGSTSGIADGSNGNQVGTTANPINPKVGPLQNNGGPTQTTALLPGSRAIDKGTNTGVTFSTDQRGYDRFANNITDIGAYEYQPIHWVAVGAGYGMKPEVKVYDADTGALKMDFLAYEPTFTAGVRVAVADMNGDGVPDIITAPAGVKVTLVSINGVLTPQFDFSAGRAPEIKVFSGADGSVLEDFNAYDPSFKAGVFIAVGDINGDGKPDIITGPDATAQVGHTNVRVFFNGNTTGIPDREFNAYDPRYGGGVRLAVGDINGDGFNDIVTALGISSGPDVKVFDGKALAANMPPFVIGEILAYDYRYFGGEFVATGDVNGDGRVDIITGTNGNGGPEVKVFSGPTVGVSGSPPPVVLDDFFAYAPAFNGGATVGVTYINGESHADILTGAGPGGGPHVRIFDGLTGQQVGNAQDSFYAFDPSFTGGVFVGGA